MEYILFHSISYPVLEILSKFQLEYSSSIPYAMFVWNKKNFGFFFKKNVAVLWCQSYLQPGNHQLMNGVNFASAGTVALVETHQGKVHGLID